MGRECFLASLPHMPTPPVAGCSLLYRGRYECDGRGWLLCLLSCDAGHGRRSHPGQCHQHRRPVARTVDLGRALKDDLRKDILPVTVLASILGGVSGAVVLLKTRQMTFLHMVPWLLLVASLLFGISGPVSSLLRKRALEKAIAEDREHQPQATPALIPLFLVLLPVCFYIGYFGAGAGFLIMSALALFGVE